VDIISHNQPSQEAELADAIGVVGGGALGSNAGITVDVIIPRSYFG
jgi:hypothetical protein